MNILNLTTRLFDTLNADLCFEVIEDGYKVRPYFLDRGGKTGLSFCTMENHDPQYRNIYNLMSSNPTVDLRYFYCDIPSLYDTKEEACTAILEKITGNEYWIDTRDKPIEGLFIFNSLEELEILLTLNGY